jgi:nucleoside-diphosphate-sugar epimerase
MAGVQNPALPAGSTVLVTGVNGLIGSHVADQLLKAGYRVRGTVRNVQKTKWAQNLFDKLYGGGKFELVEIKDLTADGVFDEALKGEKLSQAALK